jgi:hypothetical protein
MLNSVVVLLAVSRDKRALTMVGVFLVLVVLGVVAWNLSPY